MLFFKDYKHELKYPLGVLSFWRWTAFLLQASFCYFKPKEKSAYKSHFTMTDPSQRSQKRSLGATESLTQTLFQLNHMTPVWKQCRHFPKTKATAPANLWYRSVHVCFQLVGLLQTALMSLNVLWLVPFTAAMVIEHSDDKAIFEDISHFHLAVFCH